jgi:hypothetical protein
MVAEILAVFGVRYSASITAYKNRTLPVKVAYEPIDAKWFQP